MRIASRHLRGRALSDPSSAASPAPSRDLNSAAFSAIDAAPFTPRAKATRNASGKKTGSVVTASKRFGEAVWGPLAHASGVLWLEVTGLFFGIFALFFAQSVYRMRSAYRAGPEHNKFLAYAVLMAVFSYFTITSFLRSYRKSRRHSRQKSHP